MLCNKIKVIIVDDEHLIRNLLKMRIKWDEIGMEIVGEASSASEALDLVNKIIPDIIFTDICMPFMDGIEFSKIVTERYPHIKIVIITGHDEFEYAKRSIKVGISDFLLKPINGEEINKIALNLKEKIEKERNHIDAFEKLKKQLETNLPYLREKLLNELLQNDFESDEIKDSLSYFNLDFNLNTNSFQVVAIETTNSDSCINKGEEQKILIGMQCVDLIKQYFRDDSHIYVFFDNSRRIVILNNNDQIDIIECCEAIKTMIINRIKCFVSVGIGSKVKDLKNIKVSYIEACEALNYKVVVGKNQVVNYNDIIFSNDNERILKIDFIDKLNFYIKAGLTEKAEELLDDLFNGLNLKTVGMFEMLRLSAFDIITMCMHVVMELEVNVSDIWKYKSQPYEEISYIDTIPDMEKYLKNITTNITAKIYSSYTKKANKVINQIQEYLDNNLSDPDISLSNVAKEFYLSPSHLSRLFKQETSQTFVEYLTRIRIDKAIKLLKETDMKGYQIGEQIGIKDSHYFSIIFKKYTGLSVNDYRKMRIVSIERK